MNDHTGVCPGPSGGRPSGRPGLSNPYARGPGEDRNGRLVPVRILVTTTAAVGAALGLGILVAGTAVAEERAVDQNAVSDAEVGFPGADKEDEATGGACDDDTEAAAGACDAEDQPAAAGWGEQIQDPTEDSDRPAAEVADEAPEDEALENEVEEPVDDLPEDLTAGDLTDETILSSAEYAAAVDPTDLDHTELDPTATQLLALVEGTDAQTTAPVDDATAIYVTDETGAIYALDAAAPSAFDPALLPPELANFSGVSSTVEPPTGASAAPVVPDSAAGTTAQAQPATPFFDTFEGESVKAAIDAFGGALQSGAPVDQAALQLFVSKLPANFVNRLVTQASDSPVAGTAAGTALLSTVNGLLGDAPLDPRQVLAATAGEAAGKAVGGAMNGTGQVAGSVVSQLVANGTIDPDELVDPAVSGLTDIISSGTDPILGNLASPVLKGFITGEMSEKDAVGGVVNAIGAGFGPAGLVGASALNFALNAIFKFDQQAAIRNAGKQRDIAAGDLAIMARRDADVGTDPTTRAAYVNPLTGRTVLDPRTGAGYLDPTTGTPMQFGRPFLRADEQVGLTGDPYAIDPGLAWAVGDERRAQNEALTLDVEEYEFGVPRDPIKIEERSGDQYEVFARLAERNNAAAAVDPDHLPSELSPDELHALAQYTSSMEEVLASARRTAAAGGPSFSDSAPSEALAMPEPNIPGLLGFDATGDWVQEERRNVEGPYRTALQHARTLRDSGSPLFARIQQDLAWMPGSAPTDSDVYDPTHHIIWELGHDLAAGGLDLVGTPEVDARTAAIAASRAGRDQLTAAYEQAVVAPCAERPFGLLGCSPYDRAYLHPEQPDVEQALAADSVQQFNRAAAWEQEQRRLAEKEPRPFSYFFNGSFVD